MGFFFISHSSIPLPVLVEGWAQLHSSTWELPGPLGDPLDGVPRVGSRPQKATRIFFVTWRSKVQHSRFLQRGEKPNLGAPVSSEQPVPTLM